MTVYPAAAVVLLIWAMLSLRDADRGVAVMIATLPMGMFAALEASGLSILAAHMIAALTLGIFGLRWMSGRMTSFHLVTPGLWLVAFALYALFSAIVLVRLFSGEFLVFPMSIDQNGLAVSIFFNSTMKPVAPTNSNIAQAGYILLSTLIFLVICDVVVRRGPGLVQSGLVWAAGLNIVLGLMDLAALDTVLAVIRTADYTLNNNQSFLGMGRVIGGFAEPAEFGPVAATFFGYFCMTYLMSRRGRDAVLAFANGTLAVMSMSTTAFLALFVALFLLVMHARSFLGTGVTRVFGHLLVIVLSLIVFALVIAVLATPLADMAEELFTDLFLEKSQSHSGLERGAWARASFAAFLETWGLGAGAGSLRGNGMSSVLLGSLGLPGTLAFVIFMWSAMGPIGAAGMSRDALEIFCSARIAALTYLSAKMASATTPDPTLLLVSAAALAAIMRQSSLSPRRPTPHAPPPLAVRQ